MGNISANYVDGIGGFMIDILKAYQAWRRGDDERTLEATGLTPAMIGEAIDWAIGVAEERDALKAQVEQLRYMLASATSIVIDYHDENISSEDAMNDLWEVVKKTPVQNLAGIRAEAGRVGFINGADWGMEGATNRKYVEDAADEYVNQLRKQSKENTQ